VSLLVFELNGIVLAANASFVMSDDPATLDMAGRAVRRRLGLDVDYVLAATSGEPRLTA
jgi:type VI protein secretion system component VasK